MISFAEKWELFLNEDKIRMYILVARPFFGTIDSV